MLWLFGHARRRRHRRAAGDAGQDALLAHQSMRVFHRLVIAYAFHLIDQREIQVSGHEAGTEALDAVWRMGGSLARKGIADHRR